MQPGLVSRIVVARVDRFIVDVGIVAAEAGDFLSQSSMHATHQILVAAIPQFVPVTEGPSHSATRRLKSVFGHQLRIQRRQLAVPIDDLAMLAGVGVVALVHGALLASPIHARSENL